MKKLPIGMSTLKDMLEGNYVYVDKTAYVQRLVESSQYYFLSRPRRFGKSLLLDTLRQLFSANEAVFQGLHIHSQWDWSVAYPVIHISFGSGVMQTRADLDQRIRYLLADNHQRLGLDDNKKMDITGHFGSLIQQAQAKYQQPVVILIDEYDKPILDNITDPTLAAEMRQGLKNLYSAIKDNDAFIRFVFITGVSKFSKVSIFSGLNNLEDITLDENYSAICGYTQTELEDSFAEHLIGVDLSLVKQWYNGYSWLGEAVYNPFDILLFFSKGQSFRPYWFETGTPTFLIELFKANRYHLPDLDNTTVSFATLGDFDVDRRHPVTLLFQTGYLTIKKETVFFNNAPVYQLGYPNREVRYSLMEFLLENYLMDHQPQERYSVYEAMLVNDFHALQRRFMALFDSIANDNYRNNSIAHYEGYYAAVMYAYLCSLGIETHAEDTTNRGRIDLTLRFTLPDGQQQVYIFEFKVIEGEHADGSALQQIKDKQYANKYDNGQQIIFLIGMEFSKVTRNIVGFEWQQH
jgi:hypothetical protein